MGNATILPAKEGAMLAETSHAFYKRVWGTLTTFTPSFCYFHAV